jgi:hypothetical protein
MVSAITDMKPANPVKPPPQLSPESATLPAFQAKTIDPTSGGRQDTP